METIYKGIEPGTEIVDKNGHSVGKVHEVILNSTDQLQMVTVQRGLIGKHDVAIPAASIDRVEGGKIHLCVEKDTLVDMLKPDPAKDPLAAASTQDPVLVERGVADRLPNSADVRPDVLHDRMTATHTHDMGIGSAGVPGTDSGSAPLVTGGQADLSPAQSQEPTSRDRT